jgi:hypothetical protein
MGQEARKGAGRPEGRGGMEGRSRNGRALRCGGGWGDMERAREGRSRGGEHGAEVPERSRRSG